MPSFADMKKLYSHVGTIGQQVKIESDRVMESTWDNDIASRVCYIYDYYHDDQFNKKDHFTYDGTTKTRIEAKMFRSSWKSINKDRPAWYLQFKPSQPVEFTESDELYYFEKDYREHYGVDWPIGAYVDCPDENGVYKRWLVCDKDEDNQFSKYLILPCNYKLQWIEKNNNEIIKREMWGVLSNQNSYIMRFISETVCRKFSNCWKPVKSYKLQHNDEIRISVKVQKLYECLC